jgi:hypothetical protein
MVRAVGYVHLARDGSVRSQASVCGGIYDKQSDNDRGFSPSTFLSPVIIIPPTIYTHTSFIYPRH